MLISNTAPYIDIFKLMKRNSIGILCCHVLFKIFKILFSSFLFWQKNNSFPEIMLQIKRRCLTIYFVFIRCLLGLVYTIRFQFLLSVSFQFYKFVKVQFGINLVAEKVFSFDVRCFLYSMFVEVSVHFQRQSLLCSPEIKITKYNFFHFIHSVVCSLIVNHVSLENTNALTQTNTIFLLRKNSLHG